MTIPIPNYASRLEGLTLPGDWTVVRRLARKPGATGGSFSSPYVVQDQGGHQAFLKAFDLSTPDVVQDLAGHLGPIAAVMVRNTARKSATVANLLEKLAAELPEGETRIIFMRRFSGENSASPVNQSQLLTGVAASQLASEPLGATTMQRFGPDVLRLAESALSQHIGGIAKMVRNHYQA